jgi:hypothetical protein
VKRTIARRDTGVGGPQEQAWRAAASVCTGAGGRVQQLQPYTRQAGAGAACVADRGVQMGAIV